MHHELDSAKQKQTSCNLNDKANSHKLKIQIAFLILKQGAIFLSGNSATWLRECKPNNLHTLKFHECLSNRTSYDLINFLPSENTLTDVKNNTDFINLGNPNSRNDIDQDVYIF